ncbi:MAG: hypothetical protein ISR65_03795 [Bacteriovoracaceae bacterium]|nr:hypothetical protein [Bacteriovoracaceae bacterium]
MARRSYVQTYKYQCSLTEETFTTTKQAQNPEELISVAAYYDMHPEEDDRPEHIKKLSALKSGSSSDGDTEGI